MACKICNNLVPEDDLRTVNDVSLRGISITEIPLSQIAKSAKLGCLGCSMIHRAILAFENLVDVQFVDVNSTNSIREDEARYGQQNLLEIRTHNSSSSASTLQLYTTDIRVTRRWPALVVASNISVDSSSHECLDQALKWLKHCKDQHTSARCSMKNSRRLPTRVIRTGINSTSLSLYEASAGESGDYAALSYCWGQSRTFTTTRNSILHRKSGFIMEDLPKTIRHAIQVARALSIPYLWVDSLCIIQDCTQDWEVEASKMCSVYENALVTFAAIDSPDSDSGLFLTSKSRRTVKLDINMEDGTVSNVYARESNIEGRLGVVHRVPDGTYTTVEAGGILNTRGWTLQELSLSSRILWFSSDELGWSCSATTACECSPDPLPRNNDLAFPKLYITPNVSSPPNWQLKWVLLVNEFTTRNLSYPKDRLPALAGLAAAFQKHIQGRYCSGVWESDLKAQIMWHSTWYALPGIATSPTSPMQIQATDYAPSWSWASVCGGIVYEHIVLYHRKFRWFCNLLEVEFSAHGANLYGQGSGSIVVEGILVPFHFPTRAIFEEAIECETVPSSAGCFIDEIFCTASFEIAFDPRSSEESLWQDLQTGNLCLLIAGSLSHSTKDGGLSFQTYHGLLLKRVDVDEKYRRVGRMQVSCTEVRFEDGRSILESATKRHVFSLV